MRCSFNVSPSVAEARELGSWSGQKPQKTCFRNIRGDGMLTGLRLSWPVRGSVCPPSCRLRSPGEPASVRVCVRGWAEGFAARIWLAPAKSNHLHHNHGVCSRAPACWTAAVWQVLGEGFHRARLPLSSHLCCGGSDYKIVLNDLVSTKCSWFWLSF